MHRHLLALLLASLLGAHAAVVVAEPKADPLVLNSEGFLNAHPDMKYRQLGLAAYEDGDYKRALSEFKRAARYADKPSQGMVAEMLWRGEGTEVDRPAAYAWMDLAAERHFRMLLVQRENYWAALDEAERERAIEVGQALYAEFGDDVAQPRLERVMRLAKRQMTGSRTGFTGFLRIEFPTPSGTVSVDGSSYYHRDYWEPERYWAWQAKLWKDPPRGVVDIGPLQQPADAPAAAEPSGE